MILIDITGKKFGRYKVVGRESPNGVKHVLWKCVCECGNTRLVNGDSLRRGMTQSCGCLRRDKGSWNRGISGDESHSFKGFGILPKSYITELSRKAYQRGLEWDLSIEQLMQLFLDQGKCCALSGIQLSMPRKPNPYLNVASLDRIDSTKGYVVGNVQWVDRRINFMKQNMKDHEFISVCKSVAFFERDRRAARIWIKENS